MRLFFLLTILSVWSTLATAQLTDDFTDGDFNNNPEWFGNTDRFQVNTAELQLNDVNYDSPTSQLYLSAPTQGATTWEFYVRMDFNPSSTNNTRVYLNADNADFEGSLNGYYVLLGGTDDVIQLIKQTGTSSTILVSSAIDVIDVAAPTVSVRVSRDASDNWELSADVTGGTSYTSIGSAVDGDHQDGLYYGVRCRYTTTRKDKFFFDNFFVNPIYVDTDAPELVSATANSLTEVILIFNEPIDAASAADASNFSFDNGAIVSTSMIDPANPNQVIITFSSPLMNLTDYVATSTASDLAGNASAGTNVSFTMAVAETAEAFDMLINEIMADPTPQVGLPDAEFVEIYNRSSKVFNLEDYEISSGSTPQLMPNYILLPGAYVVVCDDSNLTEFTNAGIMNAVAVSSFNALSNGGDNATISNLSGGIIHSVDYTDDWYQDGTKDDGGWTLEMINPENPCAIGEGNWMASNNATGGTPGQENSVFDNTTSGGMVELLSVNVINPFQIELIFNTALDATAASDVSNYLVDNGVGNPDNIFLVSANSIIMEFNTGVSGNVSYEVTVSSLTDCANINGIDPNSNTATFQLPEPVVLSVQAQFPSETVIVTFDVPMDASSVQNVGNYSVNNGIGNPNNITVLSPTMVELSFAQALTNGTSYEMTISDIVNNDGTIIAPNPTIVSFFYFEPVALERYDIIINEFMPDPSEPVALPDLEFIEIYNRSNKIISLEGFTFESGTSSSDPLPFLVLQPGDYAIVSKDETGINYNSYNNNIALGSMISLSNDGDDVTLLDGIGQVMDAIDYDISWYQDSQKDDGGYSIERINPQGICAGAENWRASQSAIGGTPGSENSILDVQPDDTAPRLLSAFPTSATFLEVQFNEAVAADLATDVMQFSIDGGINIISSFASEPLLNSVNLLIDPATPLIANTIYELTIATTMTDCLGNPFEADSKVLFALPDNIEEGDIIINEVLFDPFSGGSDFIELYNNSDKILNIEDLTILNDVASSSPNKPVETRYLMFPNTYVVLTSNPGSITENYDVSNEDVLFSNSLPTFSADFGNVTLLTAGGVVDRFDYEDSYHFELLDDEKGVSLERIDFNAASNDRNNWHSAAADVGFATPTYQNSQTISTTASASDDMFVLADNTFSPDSDGFRDYLLINYTMPASGYLVNIKVFDAEGREIKNLVENELLSTEGVYQWDGSNDEAGKARIGIYIIWIEFFDENGNVSVEKLTCVLAGQM